MPTPLRTSLATLTVIAALAGCHEQPTAAPDTAPLAQEGLSAASMVDEADVIRIIARHDAAGDYEFVLEDADGDPVDQLPSGWTTFELDNHSSATHFAMMFRAPAEAITAAADAGKSVLEHWEETVTLPFQEEYDPYHAGLIDAEAFVGNLGARLFETAPWFFVPGPLPVGGPGLTDGHGTSRTTVHLDEGLYIIECYVKNGEGTFHSAMGMLAQLEVTNEASGTEAPEPTVEVRLATGRVDVARHIRPGPQVVAVHFDEQAAYEHLLGHDIHLIRLDPGTSVAEVGKWINWMTPEGLISADGQRGPKTFLGGAQSMAPGMTAYLHVDLEPGVHAWVAEVPDPHQRQMLQVFNVPAGRALGR